MIVDGQPYVGPTPSQTVGPFFSLGLEPRTELVDPSDPAAIVLSGRVIDGAGEPVPDAVIEIWQADGTGHIGDGAPGEWNGFGRALTDLAGHFRFVTIVPGPVPGTLTGSGATMQAPHIDVSVFARGLLNRLVTRVYFAEHAAAHATDPVLVRIAEPDARQTLVARATAGGHVFDIRLQGDAETVFFAW